MRYSARLSSVKLLLPCLILSATSGCVTGSTGHVPVSSYCAIAKPLFYDGTKDTAETVRQVEDHNSQYVCICENDCPKRHADAVRATRL